MKKKIIVILILIILTIVLVSIPKETYQNLFGNKIEDPTDVIYEEHQIVYVINQEQKLVGLKVGVEKIEDDEIIQKWNLLTKDAGLLPVGYSSPIDNKASLIDYQINNSILTFNLSEEFLNSNGKFAIASLAWTFCEGEEIKEIVVVVNDNIINKLNDYSFNRINKEIGVNYEFENMFVYDSVVTTVIHYYNDYVMPVTYFHSSSDECSYIVEKVLEVGVTNNEKYDYKMENENVVVNLGFVEMLTEIELNSIVESLKYNFGVNNIVINGTESVLYQTESVDQT